MRRDISLALALLLLGGCAGRPQPQTVDPGGLPRARPGERVRVVRFNVKPGMRARFEDFFRESLLPAAEILRPEQPDPVGTFRLLIPRRRTAAVSTPTTCWSIRSWESSALDR